MASITLFVVKPIKAVNGLPKRFRVTDVSLNGDTAVVLDSTANSPIPEVSAVLDYYYSKGGSTFITSDHVTFHGSKAQESYYSI